MENNKEDLVMEEKENKNNKEVENLDENVKKNSNDGSKFSISFLYLYWKYLYYIVLIILSVILKHNMPTLTITLGDVGTIIPVLLNVISMNGLKWIPIFSVIGILLLIFEKKFKEISKVYLISTCFITVVSILIQFII
jgi:hypothetical protein